MGAWIEIYLHPISTAYLRVVAPHVGAWIEIYAVLGNGDFLNVAPHVGAWIEIIVHKAMMGMT